VDTEKKRFEKDVFNEFCRLDGRDDSEYGHVDPPDFVNKKLDVAVELVRYHRDQSNQESAKTRFDESAKQLMLMAQDIYQKTSLVRVDSFVGMDDLWTANRESVRKLAPVLAAVVMHYAEKEVNLEKNDLPAALKGAVSWISISPTLPCQEGSLWQAVSTASPIEVVVAAVQESLRSKESHIRKYRTQASTVELLIYSSPWPCVGFSSMGNAASCGGITDELRVSVFKSSFDKVHFLDRHKGELVELRLQKPLSI
jgi:hypothetical protein